MALTTAMTMSAMKTKKIARILGCTRDQNMRTSLQGGIHRLEKMIMLPITITNTAHANNIYTKACHAAYVNAVMNIKVWL